MSLGSFNALNYYHNKEKLQKPKTQNFLDPVKENLIKPQFLKIQT